MKNSTKRTLFLQSLKFFCGLCLAAIGGATAWAQNSAFTFQGKLAEAGAAAIGQYDLQFKLYDASAGGTLLGTLLRDDVQVTQGVFTVTLDYGADVFTSNAGRYLEVGVRAGSSTGAFATISPRQELTAAPYSLQAVRAEKAGNAEKFDGLPPSYYLRSDIDQNFSGSKLIINPGSTLQVNGSLVGNGSLLSSLNATQLTSGEIPEARLPSGVPRLSANQVYTGLNVFNGGMSGNASGLSNLNASNVGSGTLGDARLSANIPRLNAGNTFSGANNNFTGQISANALSVGGGLPITKILTASATLDFGNGRILAQTLNITVPGARMGDTVHLGVPASVMPVGNLPAQPPSPPFPALPATVVTTPYVFQAHVSAPDVVSVTWYNVPFPIDTPQNTCVFTDTFGEVCENPPPGVFRVVVFSFAP